MAVSHKGCRSYMCKKAKSGGNVYNSACRQYGGIVHKSCYQILGTNAAEYAL